MNNKQCKKLRKIAKQTFEDWEVFNDYTPPQYIENPNRPGMFLKLRPGTPREMDKECGKKYYRHLKNWLK
jgi:hypothetical protein